MRNWTQKKKMKMATYREATPFIAACNDDDGDDDDDDDDYKNDDDDDCDDDDGRDAPLRRTVEAGAAGSRARGAVTGHVVDHRVHDHTDDGGDDDDDDDTSVEGKRNSLHSKMIIKNRIHSEQLIIRKGGY